MRPGGPRVAAGARGPTANKPKKPLQTRSGPRGCTWRDAAEAALDEIQNTNARGRHYRGAGRPGRSASRAAGTGPAAARPSHYAGTARENDKCIS